METTANFEQLDVGDVAYDDQGNEYVMVEDDGSDGEYGEYEEAAEYAEDGELIGGRPATPLGSWAWLTTPTAARGFAGAPGIAQWLSVGALLLATPTCAGAAAASWKLKLALLCAKLSAGRWPQEST